MQTKNTLDISKFRKELRKFKENIKDSLSDENYLLFIHKIIPNIRRNPYYIINNINEKPYNNLKDIIIKIKYIYDECINIPNHDSNNKPEKEIKQNHLNIESPQSPKLRSTHENFTKNITNNLIGFYTNELIKTIEREKDLLSVRSKNVIDFQIIPLIRSNQIKINDLLIESNYNKYRNCGLKTTLELIKFFNNIINNNLTLFSDEDLINKSFIDSVHFNTKNLISLININRQKLSVRTNKFINIVKEDIEINPKNILKYLDINQVKKMQSIGAKSSKELTEFIYEIASKITDFNKNPIEIDFEIKFETLLVKLGLSATYFNKKNYRTINYLELFELFIFNEIGHKRINILNDYLNGKNYNELSINHKCTRERIRQIVNRVIILITDKLKYFNKNVNDTYSLLIDEWEKIKLLPINEIIKRSDSKLNTKIVTFIINPSTTIVGREALSYNKELSDLIDIKGLIKKVEDLNKNVKEDFKVSFAGLAYNFIKTDSKNVGKVNQLSNYFKELEEIIYNKTNLLTNSNGELTFTRNTKIKKHEIIQGILENNGEPLHLGDISILSGIKETSIRTIVTKERHLFVNTAFSTYGLKKWEDEGRIKGGTIIDLIFKYLNSKSEPSHIYQIFKNIKQFRDTNERSIEGLIKSDTQNRFLKLGAGFYGVVGVHDKLVKSEIYNISKFKPLPVNWARQLHQRYFNRKFKKNDFISNEAKIFDTLELIVEVNLEQQFDKENITINEKGLLVFKKIVHSPKSARSRDHQ